ncbi:hypothetical protein GCM10027051_02020 [Niabella terrae]
MNINVRHFAIFIICLSLVYLSCSKQHDDRAYEKSYRSWLAFKDSSDNHYQYTKTYSSWTGYSSTYTIEVKNDRIIKQVYQAYRINDTTHQRELIDAWTEASGAIDSHSSYNPAQTLDEIYAIAKNEWLKADPKKNTVIFETRNRGMISQCGYIPNDCADDCLNGITISEIRGLP